MKEQENQTLPMTEGLKEKLRILLDLQEAKTLVMKPVGYFWWKRYDHESVIAVTKAVAEARSSFWDVVLRVYPETKNGTWNANLERLEKLN